MSLFSCHNISTSWNQCWDKILNELTQLKIKAHFKDISCPGQSFTIHHPPHQTSTTPCVKKNTHHIRHPPHQIPTKWDIHHTMCKKGNPPHQTSTKPCEVLVWWMFYFAYRMVDVLFYTWCGGCRAWSLSCLVDILVYTQCGGCLVWWMSGLVDVRWGGCLVWWMSGVVGACVVDVVQSAQTGQDYICLRNIS